MRADFLLPAFQELLHLSHSLSSWLSDIRPCLAQIPSFLGSFSQAKNHSSKTSYNYLWEYLPLLGICKLLEGRKLPDLSQYDQNLIQFSIGDTQKLF